MEQHTWWWYHTQGWWVWTFATFLFAVVLVRARQRDKAEWVPMALLALFLLSVVAHYLRSNWHQYFAINRALWLGGLGSIVVVSLLPLLVSLLADICLARVRRPDYGRAFMSAVIGIIVVFFARRISRTEPRCSCIARSLAGHPFHRERRSLQCAILPPAAELATATVERDKLR